MLSIDLAVWEILLIVGLCALLEDSVGLGMILPAETVLVAAAAAAAAGMVSVWPVLAVAWACGTAGDFAGFSIGRHFGPRLVARFGPRLRLTPERVARARDFVRKWGIVGIAAGRFIPALRILVMPVAGITRMAPGRFLAGDAIGVAGWASLHVSIGYLIGFSVSRHAGLGPLLLLMVTAVVTAGLFVHHRHHRRRDASS